MQNEEIIKSEVIEVKSEPFDQSLESSESTCYQTSSSEEEDASSNKQNQYNLLNGEMKLLQFYENQLKELREKDNSHVKETNDSLGVAISLKNQINSGKQKQLTISDLPIAKTPSDLLRKLKKVLNQRPARSASDKVNGILIKKKGNISEVPSTSEESSSEFFKSSEYKKFQISKTNSLNASNNKKALPESIKIKLERTKKRKLHEISDPLSDEEEERRRISAINAKKNREIKKTQFDQLNREFAKGKILNANLKNQLKSLNDEKKIAVLEKENAELKYQILLDKYTRLLKIHQNCSKPSLH